jgi:hypothetical protein
MLVTENHVVNYLKKIKHGPTALPVHTVLIIVCSQEYR